MLERLSNLASADYRGPRAVFNETHLLRAIFEIGNASHIGRGKLGQVLNLGQGEVRTLIARLKSAGYVVTKESGCALTPKGIKEYKQLKAVVPWISEVEAEELGLGPYNFAAIVRGKSSKVKLGIEQRDASIRGGSSGALTLVFSLNRFMVPGEKIDAETRGGPWALIRSGGDPMEGDVIIVCGAASFESAEQGLWSAILTLMGTP